MFDNPHLRVIDPLVSIVHMQVTVLTQTSLWVNQYQKLAYKYREFNAIAMDQKSFCLSCSYQHLNSYMQLHLYPSIKALSFVEWKAIGLSQLKKN